jgi:hypothetical protein
MPTPEYITSACGQFRVQITPLPTGGYKFEVYRRAEEWVPGHGKVGEFWERESGSPRFADTRERVAELAEEEFRSRGTTGPESADEE